MGNASRHEEILPTLSDVEEAAAELMWPDVGSSDRVGLEIEALPIGVSGGAPQGRLPLHGDTSVLGIVEELCSSDELVAEATDGPVYPTRHGGRITFEPGGQLEYSTSAHRDTATLNREMDEVWSALTTRFASHGVALVPMGIDVWHGIEHVPQQQRAGRYVAMDRYLRHWWPSGATMMRNTCSIQVNLEAGEGTTRKERWLVANLISPVLTAMFASSPDGTGVKSRRGRVWQSIDPSRTGLPAWSGLSGGDPVEDTLHLALSANVMFVERQGTTRVMNPGWRLADWAQRGHPTLGRPTRRDLATHLSTLFPEVRPRLGVLEMRGIDSLPRPWWSVPAVVASSLLYDGDARRAALETLAHSAPDLPDIWVRAASHGLADSRLGVIAENLGQTAIEAAARSGRVDGPVLSRVREYLERFTFRGRSPGDELSALLDEPESALAWALHSENEVAA